MLYAHSRSLCVCVSFDNALLILSMFILFVAFSYNVLSLQRENDKKRKKERIESEQDKKREKERIPVCEG